jgi:hypothetical protein
VGKTTEVHAGGTWLRFWVVERRETHRRMRSMSVVLAILKPNRIIRKHMDVNYSSFHLRVFLGLSNLQGQRQTSTLSIPRDNFGERKTKFNLEMSRTTQMQLYKSIHVP